MSASAALLQTILHTPTKLSVVSRVRIHLLKRPSSATANTQTQLRKFVEKRLPILRFHNDELAVEIKRHQGKDSKALIGMQVTAGHFLERATAAPERTSKRAGVTDATRGRGDGRRRIVARSVHAAADELCAVASVRRLCCAGVCRVRLQVVAVVSRHQDGR